MLTAVLACALVCCPLQDGHALFQLRHNLVPSVSRGRDAADVLAVLLAGPSASERAAGVTTAVPSGTRLVGLTIGQDRVTVDLSSEFTAAPEAEAAHEQVVKSLESLGRFRHFLVRSQHADGRLLPFGAPAADTDMVPAQGSPRLTPTASAPGVLSGRTIACSPGHGFYWHSTLGWTTQRGLIDGLIEDIHTNEIMLEWVIPYLEAAGAEVVHCRDLARIEREVLLDNDTGAPVYTETGSWTTGASAGHGGGTYRYALGTVVENARATWTTTVPVAGLYPVWTVFLHGTNRTTDAHFLIEHTGGTSDVAIDQSRPAAATTDDLRFIHLGSFWFDPARPARVHLVNRSSDPGRVVIADLVRLGAGMGSIARGAGTSGRPRWQECSRYWAQYMNAPATVWNSISGGEDNDDDVTCRPRYAEWRGADAFVSLHTNAGGGLGTSSYIHDSSPSTGSAALQSRIHTQIVGDVRSAYDPTWTDRGTLSANFGEVRLLSTMPGVLIELAFHDTPGSTDIRALHDPRFRQIAGRAIARGVIRYFHATAPFPPEPPANLRVTQDGNYGLRVAWDAAAGAAGYLVEQSPDGYGFDAGTASAGTSFGTGPLPHGTFRAFRVRSTNTSGRSLPTEVLVGRTGPTGTADLLLVQGFDRFERTVKEPDNRLHYLARHGDAIARMADASASFDSCTNEALVAGRVGLSGYRAVDWAAGEESTAHETFSGAEQALLTAYLAAGGRLFVSGAEIGWDLDQNGSAADRAFYRGPLAAAYVNDDSGVRAAAPAAGSVFAGLPGLTFDDGTRGTYDVDFPDSIAPSGPGATAALGYTGTGFTAAIQQISGASRVLNWGFPFETIVDPTLRARYMDRAVEFLLMPRALAGPRTVARGGSAALPLDLPQRAGRLYVLAAAGGNQPGIPLGGGRTLALATDPLFVTSLGSVSGVFTGFAGFLDAQGRATAGVHIPNLPELAGLQLFVSGVVMDATFSTFEDVLPWLRLTVN